MYTSNEMLSPGLMEYRSFRITAFCSLKNLGTTRFSSVKGDVAVPNAVLVLSVRLLIWVPGSVYLTIIGLRTVLSVDMSRVRPSPNAPPKVILTMSVAAALIFLSSYVRVA